MGNCRQLRHESYIMRLCPGFADLDWDEIKKDWLIGLKPRELLDKYGCSRATLYRRFEVWQRETAGVIKEAVEIKKARDITYQITSKEIDRRLGIIKLYDNIGRYLGLAEDSAGIDPECKDIKALEAKTKAALTLLKILEADRIEEEIEGMKQRIASLEQRTIEINAH